MRITLFSLIIIVFLGGFAIARLCPEGDLDGDCKVYWEDIRILTEQWLEGGGSADFYGDGVDLYDFSIIARDWGQRGVSLVINEFMASNNSESGIADPQGDYDDWIEIYNFGDTAIDVNGMYLTDDLDEPTKWQVPESLIVPAGGFIVFWADDDTGDGALHTNFKLDADGEEIGLFDTDGSTLIDGITFGEQTSNISYGRYPDANDELRFFATPTPLADNNDAYLGFVEDVEFSHERGFYTEDFNVTLATTTGGADIYYTLDCSEPVENEQPSATGILYTSPIHISTTANLRAIALKPGYKSNRVITHTYIFVDDVVQQPNNPPGWPSDWGYNAEVDNYDGTGDGIVPSDYEMDPRVVNNTLPGYSVQDGLYDLPVVSITMNMDDFISDASGIWANPQSYVEYKCSIEYIPIDGTEGFNEDCKIENHGGSSRRPFRMQKHNLRLTFYAPYGTAKLHYPLFPESPVETFNQLLLRASFTDAWALVNNSNQNTRYRQNDSMYIRDVWMKESLRDMGQPSSYGNFVNLYVNGLYFGIFNLTESVDDAFFAEHLGGQREDWVVNKDFYSPDARWNAVLNTDVSTIAGYTLAKQYLDVEDFADYMLLHFYADAEDWPGHNGIAAANPVSGDGKLRFFVWDQEIVLDYHNRAAQRIDNNTGAGAIFQKMRTSEEFRLLFADHVQKHLFNDGALSVNSSQGRYLEVANWIDKAIVAESARWGDTQMKTPYANAPLIPSDPCDWDDVLYPMPPHGPDYYFTREDSWLKERDCVIDHYIPDIHDTNNYYAIMSIFRIEDLFPSFDSPVFYVNGGHQHGGYIETTDTITITDPDGAGTIYYTLDGNDPRLPGEATLPDVNVLVFEDAAKKVLVPTGDIGTTWRGGSEPYDDSSWTSGTGGVGYEAGSGYGPYIDIDVGIDMYASNTTCYIRIPFSVDGGKLSSYNGLTLKLRYDDGFVAYINGVEVERVNFIGTPAWNSACTSSPEATSAWNYFDISDHIGELQAGNNILAIHGMNNSTTSSDFLICAELEAYSGGSSTDPSISPSAIEYTGGFNIDKSTDLKARIFTGSNQWSALTEAVYGIDGVSESLRITELMYHPIDTNSPSDPNTEYIELKNIGGEAINLNLVRFTNGVDFTFGDVELAAGGHILVVKDQNAFEAKYGAGKPIAGQYAGSLANDGERIELEDAMGATIMDFRYSDDWRFITDGDGYSLTIIDPDASAGDCTEVGLQAHWKLDGDAKDSSGLHNGVMYGPHCAKGKINAGLDFDGTNDYVDLKSDFIPKTGDFTINAWVNTSIGHTGALISQFDGSGSGRMILFATALLQGHAKLFIYNASPSSTVLESTTATNDGYWHMITVTRQVNEFKLYVDSNLEDSSTTTASILTGYDTLLGATTSGFRFNGIIDDVRLYNRAVSEEEIEYIMYNSLNSWDEKDSWRPSVYINGSPGWDDSGIIPNPSDVVINEVMAHTDTYPNDWIELYNTTASPVDIGGWYLSDNDSNLLKYRFAPGTTISAHDYIVVYQDVNFGSLASETGRLIPFALSENGETVCLSSAVDGNGILTGYRQKEDFGASEVDVSFGRYYKASTDNFNFVSMDNDTPGYANSYPKIGPVVISEIMYHPDWPEGGSFENDQYEYIELYNTTASAVTLYDYAENEPWVISDGIDFTFPDNPVVTIPAYGHILVVKNPTAFNWRYPGLSSLTYGPYDGKLDNAGEKVEISKPGDEVAGTRYYIRVDRVGYSDGSHPGGEPGDVDLWPTEADGEGKSLTRVNSALYGNDPNNWQAATPTPGS